MRHWLSPLLVLALLFGGAMANARYVSKSVDGWCAGVEAALAAAEAEDWEGAREALGAVYTSWDARQTYFHIMVEHAELDAAEALFGGCAMVTSDIDAAPEMTNGGRCGDVFPCGDSAALSEILRDICTDEEKIKSFGREAIRYAHERLDFENIARHAYYLLYGEVPR